MDPNTRALMMGAAGGAAAGPAVYVEDVFSTWLYTGNGSTQTITNGVDLAGKGGLVWLKDRSNVNGHYLTDSARGVNSQLRTHSTGAATTNTDFITALNANGFTLGSNGNVNGTETEASWTFRKQAKFFDVVTWVGNGSNQTISHSLGSVPGVIIAKRTDTAGDWYVYHRSLTTASQNFLVLNSTAAANGSVGADIWAPTSTTFKASTTLALSNSSSTYVAYLFADDAGGFGATGNDSIIKCGSYTGDRSSDRLINLGWEAQWVLIKPTSGASAASIDWRIYDSMRGAPLVGGSNTLAPNSNAAEDNNGGNSRLYFDALGFRVNFVGDLFTNATGYNYSYIAIRRGLMKTPTDATKVFKVNFETEIRNANAWDSLSGFPDDLAIVKSSSSAFNWWQSNRLTGKDSQLAFNDANAEQLNNSWWRFDTQSGITADSVGFNASSASYADYHFRRAPGFFDVVAYAGTGANRTVSHNLGVVPELMIVKSRNTPGGSNYSWTVYSAALGNSSRVFLNNDFASGSTTTMWNGTTPGSSSFTVGTSGFTNDAAGIYIAYLFASCPGVSKVGSYTGTGTTLSIDCGFTNGARFVLIKRTDSTGDWYVWDTARGIIAANDPYLLLNSSAAEVTNTDYIDPLNSGFQISSTASAAINANGGTFIYLAVA